MFLAAPSRRKHENAVSVLPPAPLDYVQRMPRFAEARTLIEIGPDALGRPLQLAPNAASACNALLASSRTDGVNLLLLSGFRSIDRQTQIISRKLVASQLLTDILRVNAYPGHSEHHTGRAVDFGSPHAEHLSEAFAQTPEFAWLRTRAGDFGFTLSYPPGNRHGITYEPWHWAHTS